MYFLIKDKKLRKKNEVSLIIFQSEIVLMCGDRRAFK